MKTNLIIKAEYFGQVYAGDTLLHTTANYKTKKKVREAFRKYKVEAKEISRKIKIEIEGE